MFEDKGAEQDESPTHFSLILASWPNAQREDTIICCRKLMTAIFNFNVKLLNLYLFT